VGYAYQGILMRVPHCGQRKHVVELAFFALIIWHSFSEILTFARLKPKVVNYLRRSTLDGSPLADKL
jgi:hypothetical protein